MAKKFLSGTPFLILVIVVVIVTGFFQRQILEANTFALIGLGALCLVAGFASGIWGVAIYYKPFTKISLTLLALSFLILSLMLITFSLTRVPINLHGFFVSNLATGQLWGSAIFGQMKKSP